MNYTNYIKKLCLLLIGLWFTSTYGQTNCPELLVQANIAYNQGKYEQVIALLKNDISICNFQKVEREQATKLLASALFKVDDMEEAEIFTYNFLKKNPTYEVQTTVDPLPFITMLNKFDRSPRSVIGFYVGQYTPLINTQKSYAVWDAIDYTSKYITESNLSFSLYYQYFISPKLSIRFEPEISMLKFSHEINAPDIVNSTYSEKATLIKAPISIGYEVFKKNNFSITPTVGFYGSFSSGYQYNLNYALPDGGVNEITGDQLNQRNTQNYGYQAGMNFVYTKNRLRFSAKLDYAADLNTYNKTTELNSTNNLLLDYNYVDDDLKMSHLDIKLGIAYTFSYKIKHKYRSK